MERAADRRGDGQRNGADRQAQTAVAGVPGVLHRVGRTRRVENRAGCVRRRPAARPGCGGSMIAARMMVLLLVAASVPLRADTFDAKTADFAIAFKGETSAYKDAAAFLLPRATMTIEAVGGPPGDYALTADEGTAVQQGRRKWRYTAPTRPGTYK